MLSSTNIIPTQGANTTTLQEFIQCGSNLPLKYNKFCYKATSVAHKMTLLIYNVLDDYRDEMDDLSLEVNLSDKDVLNYKFNPKKLAFDLYKSTDLYFFILYMNNMANIKEFTLTNKKLKLMTRDNLEQFLSLILSAEKSRIDKYNNAN